jgi:hypothetical protein
MKYLSVILIFTTILSNNILSSTKILKSDIKLPMPNNNTISFQKICIDKSSSLFDSKRFMIGDPNGGFKEFPTAVTVSGSFLIEETNGVKNWCFYMGTTEVTEKEYYSIVERPKKESKKIKSNYPIRDLTWFEVQNFINLYNKWLFSHALESLPKNQNMYGFLRLPTEVEWEFSARGGVVISNDEFDRKTPYHGKLQKYEWFSGAKSSHNKVKKVALLKPNPLGLYDMLGNVAEMTQSLYQIEYYQGKSGGFVSRGGHYFTSEKRLRSSLRSEQPFYILDNKTGKPKPNRQKTMGFRLLISSVVYPNQQTIKKFKEEWEQYSKTTASKLPAAVSVSSTSIQTDIATQESLKHLDNIEKMVKKSDYQEEALREISLIKSSLIQIDKTLQKADENSAYAWIKIGAEQAFFIYQQYKKLPILKKLQKIAQNTNRSKMLKTYKDRELEFLENIKRAKENYSQSLRQIYPLKAIAQQKGMKSYLDFLMRNGASEQLQILKIMKGHLDSYLKTKKVDVNRWDEELKKFSQKSSTRKRK